MLEHLHYKERSCDKRFHGLLWDRNTSLPGVRRFSVDLKSSCVRRGADLMLTEYADIPFEFKPSLLIHHHYCVCKHRKQKQSNNLSFFKVKFIVLLCIYSLFSSSSKQHITVNMCYFSKSVDPTRSKTVITTQLLEKD